jgi:hypothetical protein
MNLHAENTFLLFQLMHTISLLCRLICRHNIDCVYTDEHRKTIFVVLAGTGLLPDDGSCVNRNMSEQVLQF